MSRLLQRMKAVVSVGAHFAINTAAKILTALDSQMVELCMKKTKHFRCALQLAAVHLVFFIL